MTKFVQFAAWILVLGALSINAMAMRTDDKLFRIVEAPRQAAESSSIASKREAAISFNRSVSSSVAEKAELEIPFFDGETLKAELVGTDIRAVDDVTWRGKIRIDGFEGDVVLTFRKGFVAGIIYTPSAVYEITTSGNRQILMELDRSMFPECAGDFNGVESAAAIEEQSERPDAMIDSGDRIDVLVVYTPATKNILGGEAQAAVLAQQAIDVSNTAYINSKISQRVRMVHVAEYVYTETSSASADLSALRNNAAIQALRNTHKADLVAMIGEIQGACGIGYLMGSSSGNSNNGFTFTGRSCAVGNLSFPHELGHNMGSQHNPENGSGATYSYGYGHYVNGNFRTVMSYADPCTSGCTRVPHFSNPAVNFNGLPTGIANARDNTRSINLTDDPISNYRYSGSSLMLTNFVAPPDNLSTWNRNWLFWTSDNIAGDLRVEVSINEGATWQTLFPNVPNTGQYIIFNTGPQTPLGRLRIVSNTNSAVTDSSNGNISLR